MKQSPSFLLRESVIYGFAIITSLLLSFWIDYREEIINPDGICYVISGAAIKEGVRYAMNLCGQAHWPFYSMLLFGFSHLTNFDNITNAYVLNALFSTISVVLFVRIVKELGGSAPTLWVALFTILLWHDFNGTREYIIRDHGYWACYLLSFYFLLNYCKEPSKRIGVAWSLSIFFAALFRIEGLIFLFLLPFIMWFLPRFKWGQRFRFYLQLNLLSMCGLGCLFLIYIFAPAILGKLGRLSDMLTTLSAGFPVIIAQYHQREANLAQYVLTEDSIPHAGTILFISMTGWYLYCLISNLSLGNALLIGYAFRQKLKLFSPTSRLVIFNYLWVNFFVTFSFLLQRFFLSKRYLIALSLIFLLYVPFVIIYLMQHWRQRASRWFLIGCLTISAFYAVGGINGFSYSKQFVREAGDWLATNVPAKAKLYVNDYQLMFYSQHFGDDVYQRYLMTRDVSALAKKQWQQYDYIALRIPHRLTSSLVTLLDEISLKPIREFQNKRGERVIIFYQPH